jgi:hypothetical protein
MSYIGNTPAEKYSSFTKQDFSTSATTSYTLSQAVANENEIALFINFVRQEPTAAYTASGTTLTLTSATASSDDMYCIYLGKAVQTVNPPSGSVGTSQLASTSVTATKLNNDIISGTTALASEPADTDEFLVSDAGTLKRIDYSLIKGGGITMAQQWRKTANSTGNHDPISSNWEKADTDGAGYIGSDMTESSGIFTFPSTGIYLIHFQASIEGAATQYNNVIISTTTNNSSYSSASEGYVFLNASNQYSSTVVSFIFDVTDTSTHKVKFVTYPQDASTTLMGDSSNHRTGVTFIRLGDT